MTRENTVLHFDRSRSARAFSEEESLWEPQIGDLLRKIHRHQDILRKGRSDSDKPFLSLAIFGGYGSGKTSLLKTLVDRVRSDGSNSAGRYRHIHSLPILTLNERTKEEHFLYAVLAAILRDEEERTKQDRESRSGQGAVLSPVKKAIHRLSEHLHVLDEPARRPEHDPMGLSIERLERHSSDMELREEVGKLIEQLAKNALPDRGEDSVVLLPVDDADMSKDRLLSSLATCQRYLQHHRLIPIFTLMGRIAEGLLRHNFSQELVRREESAHDLLSKSGEAPLEEQMAVQHLAKMFTVRNRVRIGSPTRRLHEANYHFEESWRKGDFGATLRGREDGEREGIHTTLSVIGLLESATKLLYGHPEPAVTPRVPVALRPATLRRQLQVLDAMYAAGLPFYQALDEGNEEFHKTELAKLLAERDPEKENLPDNLKSSQVFDRAAWSLLDLHRDVLKDLDLFLDEIIGWDAASLRERLLERLLLMDQSVRSHLLQSWRHRATSLRSQVYSLLGLTVFRPRLESEEAAGEKPPRPSPATPDTTPYSQGGHLTAGQGVLWFLDLWLGFYFPLWMLGQQGDVSETPTGSHGESTTSAGWNLSGASDQIVLEGLRRRGREAIPGVVFYNENGVEELATRVNPRETAKKTHKKLEELSQLDVDEEKAKGNFKNLIAAAGTFEDEIDRILKEKGRIVSGYDEKSELEDVTELKKRCEELRKRWDSEDADTGESNEIIKSLLETVRQALEEAADRDLQDLKEELVNDHRDAERELAEALFKFCGTEKSLNPHVDLLLGIWCSYGYDKHTSIPWGATNLWRGLELFGRLLVYFERHRSIGKTGSGTTKLEVRESVESIITSHLKTARMPSAVIQNPESDFPINSQDLPRFDSRPLDVEGGSNENGDADHALLHVDWIDRRYRDLSRSKVIDELCHKLVGTEENHQNKKEAEDGTPSQTENGATPGESDSLSFGVLVGSSVGLTADPLESASPTEVWRSSFVRRLHGDHLLGTFLPLLEDSLTEQIRYKVTNEELNADKALVLWVRNLTKYWGIGPIRNLLEACPFISPFTEEGKKKKFLEGSFKEELQKLKAIDESSDDDSNSEANPDDSSGKDD